VLLFVEIVKDKKKKEAFNFGQINSDFPFFQGIFFVVVVVVHSWKIYTFKR